MTEIDEDPTDSGKAALETEATGETVGEAKWTAIRDLERRFPGLDKRSVEFVVISEGERGLLGVGFVPARVLARVGSRPPAAPGPASAPSSPAGARLQELLEHVRRALGVDATVSVVESEEALTGTFNGRDLGLVIGKHGQTIDAIQYLAATSVSRVADPRPDVVVDAAGYRSRRRATLESLADRAAAQAATAGETVPLDPMTAADRKIVHVHLKERNDVVTTSEGTEPARYVVVGPA